MSSAAPQETFDWWDAWILLAVIYATRSSPAATLAATIAAADYINHAIVTRGELETGLRRLFDNGLLTHNERGYSPGELPPEFWAAFGSQRRTVADDLQAVTSFLGTPRSGPGPPPSPHTEDFVTKAQYKAAVDEYQGRMRSSRRAKRRQNDA